MPYIPEERRERLNEHGLPYVSNVDELEYVIVKIAEELLWKMCDYDWAKLTATRVATVSGALTTAALEFQRRIVTPFNEGQRERWGDIFVYPNREQWVIEDVDGDDVLGAADQPAPLKVVNDERKNPLEQTAT